MRVLAILFVLLVVLGPKDNLRAQAIQLQGVVRGPAHELLPFTILKFHDGGRELRREVADFDGAFRTGFCSNACSGKVITVDVIPFEYPPMEMKIECRTDSALVFLVRGPNGDKELLTKDSLALFLRHFHSEASQFPCGEAFIQADPRYRHCDGTIKHYSELSQLKVHWSEWTLLDD